MCPPMKSSPAMSADEARYRAEDDCRTLERGEEIRSDRGRLKAATAHARNQVQRMRRISSMGRGKARSGGGRR